MRVDVQEYRVRPRHKVDLKTWPTLGKPLCKSKKEYKRRLKDQVEELSSLQRLHYASDRYALLIIFQAMDAAGKDGAIRHVLSGVNPQGCQEIILDTFRRLDMAYPETSAKRERELRKIRKALLKEGHD